MRLHHPHRHRPISQAPPEKPEMLDVIDRNITTMVELRREEQQLKNAQDKAPISLPPFRAT